MKISVILPCFNAVSTLGVQLEALCRQSWNDEWEVVVSNNGSTDGSMIIVEQYRNRLPNLKIVEAYTPPGPRLGACHSYNAAFKVATGDAFVLCEADDEVGDGWLTAMGRALLEHDFVVARMEYRRLNPAWVVQPLGNGVQETTLPQVSCYPYLKFAWGCSFGLRRIVYETLGEFNLDFSYVFDSEYCFKAQLAGIDIHLVEDAFIHYRLRQTLKACFKQKRNWGEEFTLMLRCYGAPSGKLTELRSWLKITQLALAWAGLMVGQAIGISDSRRLLFLVVADLGWQLGAIKGRQRPLLYRADSSALQPTLVSATV